MFTSHSTPRYRRTLKKLNNVTGVVGRGAWSGGAHTQHHNTDGLGKKWNNVRGDQ